MKSPTGEVTTSFKNTCRAGLLRGSGLVVTVTMTVAEVHESEVRVVKQAVETGKASVESAMAGVCNLASRLKKDTHFAISIAGIVSSEP